MKRIPDEDLLDEIKRLADGKSPPTCTEFDDKAKYHSDTVFDRWGSWNAALQEAGFTPNVKRDISEKDILSEINRLADGNSPPIAREFADSAEYSPTTVGKKFGSWNAALQEAGFTPNAELNISHETLLKALQKDAQEKIATRNATTHTVRTYHNQFESWWQACVQAGLQPHLRRPLTHAESRSFFEAAIEQQKPRWELIGLLAQFTGLTPRLLPKISIDWITTPAENTVVTVPANETRSGEKWTFKLPGAWIDDTGERRETGLSGLLSWVIEQDGEIDFSRNKIKRTIYRIAQEAGLPNREKAHRDQIGNTPLVRHGDLRATGGIQMARNDAPARRIRRHLGIKHTNWTAEVDDFFLWLYVHEGHEHPDYDPPDVVLDPDTGEPRYS